MNPHSNPRRPRLGADARGISSTEYVIALILVAVLGIGAWRTLGVANQAKVRCAIQTLTGGGACAQPADPSAALPEAPRAPQAPGPDGDQRRPRAQVRANGESMDVDQFRPTTPPPPGNAALQAAGGAIVGAAGTVLFPVLHPIQTLQGLGQIAQTANDLLTNPLRGVPEAIELGRGIGQGLANWGRGVRDAYDNGDAYELGRAFGQAGMSAALAGEAAAGVRNLVRNGGRDAAEGGAVARPVAEVADGEGAGAGSAVRDGLNDAADINNPGGCFTADTLVATARGPERIADVHVGERVRTRFDEVCESAGVKPTAESWRLVTLQGEDKTGTGGVVNIEAIRSLDWLKKERVRAGGQMAFPLPSDHRLTRLATVLAISALPAIQSGPGCLVLTSYATTNQPVIELAFAENETTVQPTPGHLFYSDDRDDWVHAADLAVGEHVRTHDGVATVASEKSIPGTQTVHNLEIDVAHTYLVSSAELYVHNNNLCAQPPPAPRDWASTAYTAENGNRAIGLEDATRYANETAQRSSALRRATELWNNPNLTNKDVYAFLKELREGARKKYGIEIEVDNTGTNPRLHPNTPRNYMTYDEANRRILYTPEAWETPQRMMSELIHEWGAVQIARDFGGKANIPSLFGGRQYWLTHMLDDVVKRGAPGSK